MLTPEEVKKYATTPIKAREISIRHWWQNYMLKKEEILALKKPATLTAIDMCGLCMFFYPSPKHGPRCQECLLFHINCCVDTGSLYQKASRRLEAFIESPTDENYNKWRTAAKAMHKCLCSLRSK
jgi:hypothetical protein